MVNLKIDGQKVSVPAGTTILEAAEHVGINIPHLCYLKDINDIGACRICLVEIVGMEKLVTSCNTPVEENMEILTNSPKVRTVRRVNLELILSDHDCKCVQCVKSGNCTLQSIANDMGIIDMPYRNTAELNRWNRNYPLIREASKCVKCMRCVQVCDKIQNLSVWDLCGSGYRTTVGVSKNMTLEEASCSLCGQCITHCPVGALRARDDRKTLRDILSQPDMITMVQIAPAVRTAWGEGLGLARTEATMGKLITALRRIGFDYVFDTTYTADLTIMEEGSEFVERLKHRDEYEWPMFTSCCPGWIRFVKTQYPELVGNLSTAKSPQQMFGAVTKSYYAEKLGVEPERIFCVSLMPCLAKKDECTWDNGKDVDAVLTTREVERMLKSFFIKVQELEEEEFDDPLGVGSGAGVIFGATGGVMEAALRSAYYLVNKTNPEPDAFQCVRGLDGWKEAKFTINGNILKVAVASSLSNARKLMEAIATGKAHYDFVEVMACPGGCINGGGQPIKDDDNKVAHRSKVLYGLDKVNNLRFSHENPSVMQCYKDYFGEPLSHKAHELLHISH